jgi:hypothetical protein
MERNGASRSGSVSAATPRHAAPGHDTDAASARNGAHAINP